MYQPIKLVSCFIFLFFFHFVFASEEKFIPLNSPDSYQNQESWKKLQEYLPEDYRLNDKNLPKEYFWDWQGNSIHLDRYDNKSAKAKVILLHGVGTNGRQITLIVGHPLSKLGYETISIDAPFYGLTKNNKNLKYDDWVNMVNDFVNYESRKDKRPIFLYGLSAGGMLTYHVASINPNVKGIIGMTFLDQRNTKVAKDTMQISPIPRTELFAMKQISKTQLANIKLPMLLVSKMQTLVNNKDALKMMLSDSKSAGNNISIRFLNSYINYKYIVEPEYFSNIPILLTQPEKDRWTPLELSLPFLNRIKHSKVTKTILPNAGHYPIEEEGLHQLTNEIDKFIQENLH